MFGYKKNHSLDSPVKLGFCLSKTIGQYTSLDFWSYNISLIFERSLYKELVKMPRGFEVLKIIHQSPNVLAKIRVWDFIRFSWEVWSETLHMAFICLEDHMSEVLIINFEGKWINWFRGENGYFGQNQSKSRLTKWIFGQPSTQGCTFHISSPFWSLDQRYWGLGRNLFMKKP